MVRAKSYKNENLRGAFPPKSAYVRLQIRQQIGDQKMQTVAAQYLPIAIFIAIAGAISLALMLAPFILAYKQPEAEKLSPYECGFEPFDDARMKFDVRFYLVAMLFIIFDLEVIFLFPWALTFKEIGDLGFWAMMVFLAELTIGLIYAWKKGALEWD